MKSTGIIRRMDDLGRVVIPKEIRRTLNIEEGEPFEIYTEENAVIFKKYEVVDTVQKIRDLISNIEHWENDEKQLINDLISQYEKNHSKVE
jgi:stage V sporulation protein T